MSESLILDAVSGRTVAAHALVTCVANSARRGRASEVEGDSLLAVVNSTLEQLLVVAWFKSANSDQMIQQSDSQHDELAPITVREVPLDRHRELAFKAEPLRLKPFVEERGELICVQEESLHIHAFAATRDDLLKEINEQILMLWREYALEADEKLSAPAQTLKQTLKERLEVVPNAQG